jgi:hypothetical protein
MIRNYINFLHSITASILSYFYICNPDPVLKRTIFYISHTYFLQDTYQIRNEDSLDIAHHILSLFALYIFCIGYHEDIIIRLFNYAEISNIALFGHYLIIKKCANKRIILTSSVFEFLIYTYYRVFLITQLLIDKYDIILFTPLSLLLVIYYMGIDWSYTLFNNLIDDFKSY